MQRDTYGISVGSEKLADKLVSMARISCGCGAHAELSLPGGLNPHHAKKSWERKGWECDGKRWTCPPCVLSRRSTRRGESGMKFIVPPAQISIEGLARVKQRDVMRAITPFLDADGKYMLGMTDELIAQAVGGVTAEQVRLMRRMSPVDVLSNDELRVEVSRITDELAKLEPRLNSVLDIASTIESVMSDLRGRAQMLQEELNGGHYASAGAAD